VLRVHLLAVTGLVLAVAGPLGCPQLPGTDDDNTATVRETLAVTANGPESGTVDETVELTAAAQPPAGATVTYRWVQAQGPGVHIANADRATASFTAPSLASSKLLVFTVTATAGDAVGRASVSVWIPADPDYVPYVGGPTYGEDFGYTPRPVADAGNDQTIVAGETATLDASGSTGRGLTYRWRQISGPDVTLTDAETVAATFTVPARSASESNILQFQVTVTDREDVQVTDRVRVHIPVLVRMATSRGNIDVALDEMRAPVTVANFLSYVDDDFYEDTIFHRVIEEFVIQGGGYDADLEQKDTNDPIANEASNGLNNDRGTIAMARLDDPDSATSQFFINLVDNDSLNPGGVTPEGYAVFGFVVDGLDVVDEIGAVATESRGGLSDVPVDDVVINSIRRI
jgi:cyclophilin family peptidyl-prolyl cis-trans isomerase